MPDKIVDLEMGDVFIGYGVFMLGILMAIIAPDLTHQHLNYGSFPFDVRVISRYGFLSISFGVLLKKVLGGVI